MTPVFFSSLVLQKFINFIDFPLNKQLACFLLKNYFLSFHDVSWALPKKKDDILLNVLRPLEKKSASYCVKHLVCQFCPAVDCVLELF